MNTKVELIAFPMSQEDYILSLEETYSEVLCGIQVGKVKIVKDCEEELPIFTLEIDGNWLDVMYEVLKGYCTVREVLEELEYGETIELPPETPPSNN
jgi:hypothetical protein